MTKKISRIPGTNTWQCLKCNKIVKEQGWAGHLSKHKVKIHEVNKHIDTY